MVTKKTTTKSTTHSKQTSSKNSHSTSKSHSPTNHRGSSEVKRLKAHSDASSKSVLSTSNKLRGMASHKSHNDDLYVCITDVLNKRKSLLNALKDVLIAQEEYEILKNTRSKKYHLIEEFKSNVTKINSLYMTLEKLFPNTKHIISFAEKELHELEHQVNLLHQTMDVDQRELEELETLEHSLVETEVPLEEREELIHGNMRDIYGRNDGYEYSNLMEHRIKPINEEARSKHSKLSRIQNNLAIIEQKLKQL